MPHIIVSPPPELVAGSIVTADIANEAVTAPKIAKETITIAQLANVAIMNTTRIGVETVLAANLKNLNVTEPKLGEASVTGKKVKVGTPEAAKELKENIAIEASATASTTVMLSVLAKAEETVGEVIVDGVSTFKIRKETLAASSDNIYFTFRLKATATFEVKMTTGKIETEATNKSVYSVQEG